MVGIAVSDVRLSACGKLLLNLVTNVVVTADLAVLNSDVGVDLIESFNCSVKLVTKSLAHGVGEGDSNLAAVVTVCRYFVANLLGCGCVVLAIVIVAAVAGVTASKHSKAHDENKKECNDLLHLFFHPFCFLLFFKTYVIKTW